MQTHLKHYVRVTSMLAFEEVQDKISDRHEEYLNAFYYFL